MATATIECLFSDSKLDLSFSFQEAASANWNPRSSPPRSNRLSGASKGYFDPLASGLAGVPIAARYSPEAKNGDRQRAAGSGSAMPTSQFQAPAINSEQRKSTGNSPKAKLTMAEFASGSSVPVSYNSYTTQSKPLPTTTTSTASASRVSSVSTRASTISIDTTLDYSLFPVPPKDQYRPFNPTNPQPRPEQFIQQSARRPISRVVSPRQSSFSPGQKAYPGQRAYRANSRGPGRRTSIRKSHHPAPGKPRLVGDMKNLRISTIPAQRIHVVRPAEKPVLVSVPRSLSMISEPDVRYTVARSEVSAVSSLGPELPKLSMIIIPQAASAPPPQELPATTSPREQHKAHSDTPPPQYPALGGSRSPPPMYTPYRPPAATQRSSSPGRAQAARYTIPQAPPVPRYSGPEPLSSIPETPVRTAPAPPWESEKVPASLKVPVIAASEVGTIWPSWEEEEKATLAKKEKEEKEKEKREKKAAEACPPSPSDAGTTWPPRDWGKEDEEGKKKEKKLDDVHEENEDEVVVEKVEKVEKVEAPQVAEVKVDEERMKRYEIPDVLKIGNKANSSLFQRLGSWESLELWSRY